MTRASTFGGGVRAQWNSLELDTGAYQERHDRAQPGGGVVDALVQYNELSYVVYPWLVPAVRVEYVKLSPSGVHGGDRPADRSPGSGAGAPQPQARRWSAQMEKANGAPPRGVGGRVRSCGAERPPRVGRPGGRGDHARPGVRVLTRVAANGRGKGRGIAMRSFTRVRNEHGEFGVGGAFLRGRRRSGGLPAGRRAGRRGGGSAGKVEATPAKFLEETVVYLKEVPGSLRRERRAMDQKGMKFLPHVLAVTRGRHGRASSTTTRSTTTSSPRTSRAYNLGTFKPGRGAHHTSSAKPGRLHPALQHPPGDARLHLRRPESVRGRGRPRRASTRSRMCRPGTYTLAVWNSHLKAAEQNVTVAEGKTGRGELHPAPVTGP